MTLYGMPVSVSPYAVSRKAQVERLPIRKRRKGYRVVFVETPCAYVMAGRYVMHPDIYAKLRDMVEAIRL